MKQKVLQNKYCRWRCIELQPPNAESSRIACAACPCAMAAPGTEGFAAFESRGSWIFGKRIVKNNQISRKITSVALQLDRI
jgi:hypothetical protein